MAALILSVVMVSVSTDTAGNTAKLRLSGGKRTVNRITPKLWTCSVPVGCGQEVDLKVFESHALFWVYKLPDLHERPVSAT